MSCCFIKKDRKNSSALAAHDKTSHLHLIVIPMWKDKCNSLQVFLQRFQIMRAFSNFCKNFQKKPTKKEAKRLRIQREIKALNNIQATRGPLTGLLPLNRNKKGIRL